jgi:hypothetical protein
MGKFSLQNAFCVQEKDTFSINHSKCVHHVPNTAFFSAFVVVVRRQILREKMEFSCSMPLHNAGV